MRSPLSRSAVVVGALLLSFAAVFLAREAVAAPPRAASIEGLMRVLNGSPVRLGVIAGGAGTSTTNISTGTAFTIRRADALLVVCDVQSFCIEGTSASSSYTNAAFGVPMSPNSPRQFVSLPGSASTTTWACVSASAFNCVFFSMDGP